MPVNQNIHQTKRDTKLIRTRSRTRVNAQEESGQENLRNRHEH